MSIQYINGQIANIDRDIHSTENQINSIEGNISRKQKEANSILERISREKDIKKIIPYQKELVKKNEDISKFEKEKSSKNKSLSDKRKKKGELLQALIKEEQKERGKTKKEQKEILFTQQQITREMEHQRSISLNTITPVASHQQERKFDVFVSHASEDKEDFVRPFAGLLKEKGLKVWYDDFELKLGDGLRRSIDNGLRNSKFGIVILSEAFFNKEWPQRELDGLFAREIDGEKIILPIWHKISKNEVMKYSPMIADIVALNTSNYTVGELAEKIAKRVLEERLNNGHL